jgi:hypothetical protein
VVHEDYGANSEEGRPREGELCYAGHGDSCFPAS